MKNYIYYGNANSDTTVIYLHGGGYVMGDQSDLPTKLSEYLMSKYSLITLNYPLAPQCAYADIINYVENHINDLSKEFSIKKLILMGRSSGSNTIMSIDPNNLDLSPSAIISFYGYSSSDLSWMSDEIVGLDFKVNKDLVSNIENNNEIVYSRDLETTYPYYYALRKSKRWPSVINIEERSLRFSSDIPIFIAHSIFDTDVPFKAALELRNHFSKSTLYTSTSKKHAFDHDSVELDKLLPKLNDFLNNLN